MKPKCREVSLDINEIALSVKKNAEMLEPLSDNCCIYKVPPHLSRLDREACTPQVVSIGPYHHGRPELKSMENHKLRYLDAFLERIKMTLEEYIEGVKELEIRLRGSYMDIDGYDRREFIGIMAVDGAFLMQFLLTYRSGQSGWNDGVFGLQKLHGGVKYDLVLLENQLPFFYLEHLFALYEKSNNTITRKGISLMKIVQEFLSDVAAWVRGIVTEERPAHILHILLFSVYQLQRKETKESASLSTPTISELHQAGVKFKPSSSHRISFADGVLEIPKFRLTDDIELLYRNMQAFEQCHLSSYHIGDYVSIMYRLVNNGEDVRVLVKNGIIENWLGDINAAAAVFNNLSKGNVTDPSDFLYTQVVVDLNAYCKTQWHMWKAALKQNYFSSPWTIISVVAAGVLLILTIIQTACSILEVKGTGHK